MEGRTRVNQAMITGEIKAVERGEQGEVIGSGVNGKGAMNVKVEETGTLECGSGSEVCAQPSGESRER